MIRRILLAVALVLTTAPAFAQHGPGTQHSGGARHAASAAPHGSATHQESTKHETEHEHELGRINWFDFTKKDQPPWGTYAINLALLIGIYWYFGKDAVKKGLAERRNRIKSDIDEAQKLLDEAKSREKKYKRKLAELDSDRDQAKKSLEDAGAGERDRIVREAKEKAARMERDAQFLVEQELKQMHADVVRETLDATVRQAEELLKRSINIQDQERLAEEYLDQLAALPSEPRRQSIAPPSMRKGDA